MGCGTIKTSESSEQYDDNINQSELLPTVHFNKKSNISNIQEVKSVHSSNQNDKKSEKIENTPKNSSKNNKKSKNSKNSVKSIIINRKLEESIKIKDKDNENSKINSESNNSSSNLKSFTEKESQNKNNKEEKVSESENSNSNSNTSKDESKKESMSISKNENINNKNEEKESLLKKKAYTTDKLPHSNANISFSSNNEEKLPKVIQNNEFSNGYLDKKFLEIELKANRYETIFPIWISKDEEIEFIISGKWKINNEIECDSKGIEIQKDENSENFSEKENNFNDGALVGRILKGKPFLIYNELKYISDISGPLILKMNINSLWSKEQPQGVLKIKIYGAQKIENVLDLDEKIGWWKQLRNIEYNNKDHLSNYELSGKNT